MDWKVLSKLWGPEEVDLDYLIKERKEEKRKVLKEKLDHGLKTIGDRRVSEANHDPFPDGTFERLQSNKIWAKVLGYLTDPSDVTSAYFACGTFAGILEQRRKLLMFSKVLTVFKAKSTEAYEADDKEMGNLWYENWEGISLSARGISKAWKETADHALFEYDLREDVSFRHILGERKANPRLVWFGNEESVDQLMSLVSEDQTPSIIRRVLVAVTDRIAEPFFAKLMEFFWTHGKHVSTFYFQCNRSGNTVATDAGVTYERFCDMLECMPNLRSLHFRFNPDQEQGEGAREALLDFKRKLNQRPFPSLASLEHFNCSWNTDESLLSQILRKCANLRSVSLPLGQSVGTEEMIESLMGVPLEYFYGSSIMIIPKLYLWPLKHLVIDAEVLFFKASQVFPGINRFGGTLQYLFLVGCPKIDSMNFRLDLPHLKFLLITRIKPEMGLDGLLLLKSLEKLILWGYDEEDKNSKVKVMKYWDSGEMDKSNVWQCFSNLKRLHLRHFDPNTLGNWFDRPTSL